MDAKQVRASIEELKRTDPWLIDLATIDRRIGEDQYTARFAAQVILIARNAMIARRSGIVDITTMSADDICDLVLHK
jgi:hypothetical protein